MFIKIARLHSTYTHKNGELVSQHSDHILSCKFISPFDHFYSAKSTCESVVHSNVLGEKLP